MKAKRYNPCTAIRNTLHNAGYSTVKVTNAVNSALGELGASKEESKLGESRLTKTKFKVREMTATDYEGDTSSVPLRFDVWCGLVAKAEKVASFESIEIPGIFRQWMDKFAKADKDALAKESVIS